MLLLNPFASQSVRDFAPQFTFQYASIKPKQNLIEQYEDLINTLHFNMLLLNLTYAPKRIATGYLYISICFY